MLKKAVVILKNEKIVYGILALTYLFIEIIFKFFLIYSGNFYSQSKIAPIFIILSFILLNISIIYVLPKKGKIIYYLISMFLYFLMFTVQYFHFAIIDSFFSFSEIFLINEGLEFIKSINTYINYKILIILFGLLLAILIGTIFIIKVDFKISKRKKFNKIILAALILQLFGIATLINESNGMSKEDPLSPINNYQKFSVPVRAIQITGLGQYFVQDIGLYYYYKLENFLTINRSIKKLNAYFDIINIKKDENKYSNIFKDKNLIYVMVESLDTWHLNNEYMPTLYKMSKEGLNFTNRYAPAFYAGYTFNSEFAAVTGLYLTDGFDEYINNSFPYSLPNLFKNSGYSVKSFHMNSLDFYKRGEFHKSFGFEEHVAEFNNDDYRNLGYDFAYDTSWIDYVPVYNRLVNHNEKFMSFLVTYTMHMPYINNHICDKEIREGKVDLDKVDLELWCIKTLAKETDNFFKKLLNRLEEDKLLDNTVIVVFSDHFMYGYSDEKNLNELKGTSDSNLKQNTPLIIWSKDKLATEIDTLMSTADLVPTLANMFSLDFNPENYLSSDVFSKKHSEYVPFKYGYWISNNYYYNGKSSYFLNEETKNINKKVNEYLKINDMILKTDYYKE